MHRQAISDCYRLIGELLLYPEERDGARIDAGRAALRHAPAAVRTPIERFARNPEAESVDLYLQTIEMTGACPLYVGAYLFEEPKSCRGAGLSGRNAYMLELANAYRHFGFDLNGRELADFLPVILEFLAISLERRAWDRIGLRRWIVERRVTPAIPKMASRFEKHDSPYALLVEALDALLHEDAQSMCEDPIWLPPADDRTGESQVAAPCPFRQSSVYGDPDEVTP
ncbi:MAG: nitrate reductase molybdenum cofactor assembly chaperone [Parvularculaceae bacterium]